MKNGLRVLLCLPVLLCLCGFPGCDTINVKTKAVDPFDPKCDQRCFIPCAESSALITADPDSAIIAKKYEHALRDACEERRYQCVQCINRGKDAKAIK